MHRGTRLQLIWSWMKRCNLSLTFETQVSSRSQRSSNGLSATGSNSVVYRRGPALLAPDPAVLVQHEPVAERPFDDLWERELTCVSKVKDKLHRFIQDQINCNRVPLCINPSSAAFKSFASSTVAHPSELPPSPHHWE